MSRPGTSACLKLFIKYVVVKVLRGIRGGSTCAYQGVTVVFWNIWCTYSINDPLD